MSDHQDTTDNAAQIAYWNELAGANWTALQEHLDTVFAPLTAIALGAAAPMAGEHVLDTGCGCGATTLELARLVGPTGHVLGLDVSQPMTTRARERIAAAGLTNAEILVADAATATLPAVDLLFSRFGVMFFADPVAAFANLRQAVRPGGRLLCAVWRPLAENPWFHVPLAAVRDLLPPQPPAEPFAPGPFAFADPGRVTSLLTQAGWRDVAMTPHNVPMPMAPQNEIAQATEFAMRIGAVARMLADADPDLRARAQAAIAQAMEAHNRPEGIVLVGSIWLLSARA